MRQNLALDESHRVGVKLVALHRPFDWLAMGWQDLRRCPGPALLHGAALALFGAALLWAARGEFWLLAGAFSGFLLVAPVLATGLYAISRARSRGEAPDLRTAIDAWRPRDGRLVAFGLLFSIARVLAHHRINLQLAKITTLGERVEDTFLIDGPALQQNRVQLQIETELLDALAAS